MIRKIIHIDEEKCNGCGACAAACHEGAIGMVNGKAKLLRDDYCDGLGDCLPACPTGAITFVEREAAAYDEQAVLANKKKAAPADKPVFSGCPGSRMRQMDRSGARFRPRRAPDLPAGPVALPDQAGAGERPLFQRREAAHRRRLHRLRLRQPAQRVHARAKSPSSAAPSWMRGITAKSSPRSSEATTFRASPWCAWRCPAAAGWKWRRKRPSSRAGNSSRGRWSPSPSTEKFWTADSGYSLLSYLRQKRKTARTGDRRYGLFSRKLTLCSP